MEFLGIKANHSGADNRYFLQAARSREAQVHDRVRSVARTVHFEAVYFAPSTYCAPARNHIRPSAILKVAYEVNNGTPPRTVSVTHDRIGRAVIGGEHRDRALEVATALAPRRALGERDRLDRASSDVRAPRVTPTERPSQSVC